MPTKPVPVANPIAINPARWNTAAYRASCLAWVVTGGTLVPGELQLRSCLATHNNQDSLIYAAGTGRGKTLPIALTVICYLTTQLMDPFEVQDVSQIGTFPKGLFTKMPVGLGWCTFFGHKKWQGYLNSEKPIPLQGIDVLVLERGSGYESKLQTGISFLMPDMSNDRLPLQETFS